MGKRNNMCKRIFALCMALVLGMLTLAGCQSSGNGYTVTFNTCTNLETNKLKDRTVKEGEKMQIELTPTAGNEEFYKKSGFKYKPDVITGMYLWIKK